jgi:RimJ/RimL family protein N-acetyltransferase
LGVIKEWQMMDARVQIEPLTGRRVDELMALHVEEPSEYTEYFTPFPFDAHSIKNILKHAQRDLYFVVLVGDRAVGFYMLRGFDQGYATPAYGVWISQRYSRMGLARLTLEHAVTQCRQLGCKNLMLKVHPDNTRAKRIYEAFGFQAQGIDSRNHNLIYCLPI